MIYEPLIKKQMTNEDKFSIDPAAVTKKKVLQGVKSNFIILSVLKNSENLNIRHSQLNT